MKRVEFLLGRTSVVFNSVLMGVLMGGALVGCSSGDGGAAATGGRTGTGGGTDGGVVDAPSSDVAGSGGSHSGGAGGQIASAGGAGGRGGAGGSPGSASGGAGGAARSLAQLCGVTTASGAGGGGGGGGSDPGAMAGLTFSNQTYATDPRVRATEALFSYINTVDDPNTQVMRLHNGGTAPVEVKGLWVVDNVAPAGTPAPATPGARGGTLFPLNYSQVSMPSAFQFTAPGPLPRTLAAGEDLDVTVKFLSTKTSPPDRMLNIGGQPTSAVLVAETAAGCVPAGLYAIALWNNSETPPDPVTGLPSNNWARYEPTFGQIVATLGYKVNLGAVFIQLLNTNDTSLPGPGFATEEVQVHEFVKANSALPVQLLAVGRFAPPTDLPYGWYPVGSLTGQAVGAGGGAGGAGGRAAGGAGGGGGLGGGAGGTTGGGGGGGSSGAAGGAVPPPAPAVIVSDAQPAAIPPGSTFAATKPAPLRVVGTMLSSPRGVDWNTSNHSIQILPPLSEDSTTEFDPGASTRFGIWSFTNQRSVGNPSSAGVPSPAVGNGDYNYSEDALNVIGSGAPPVHRVRVYPLRDRAGALVPDSYLLGWEEASNGDYQDFVFILRNAKPAP